MIRLIAVVSFALFVATSAQAIAPAPVPQSDEIVIQVREGCGVGRIRGPRGNCVARSTIRQARRAVRRCLRWHRGVCARWAW